ncbi:MAG: cbb3-type cytochrome c oxidase subunit 3 [Rhodospirillaceae bacterium]|jgi:cytochrome c oxidase cbb3-type subunit IV|nr:cbb3-type cytochrome c oxidase subunit 3 [Rhodospirillaceae bacterium]MBT5456082.1 cbb3-type cytochrome c oxidase subunit 3 [Rhodospirillaceae bacterium]
MDYETIAAFARTYGLVYLTILFIAVLAYALWPRNKKKFDHAARIPLRED